MKRACKSFIAQGMTNSEQQVTVKK